MRASLLTALVIVAFTSSPGVAAGQSAQDRATARQLAGDAEKKLTTREYDGAYELFSKAYALVPAPTLQLAMGRSKVAMGQLIEAQELLVQTARSAPQPGEAASWAQARRDGEKEAAALSSRIPMIDIVLDGVSETTPATSLRIFVDKEDIKSVIIRGTPRAVNPGNHGVRAEGEGYKPAEISFKIAETERKRITLKLESLVATTDVVSAPPPPLSFAPATAPASNPTPPPTPERGTFWNQFTIAGVAVLGATVGTGLVTGYISLRQANSIKDECTPLCPASRRDDADSAKT